MSKGHSGERNVQGTNCRSPGNALWLVLGLLAGLSVAGHGMHDIPRFTPLHGVISAYQRRGAGGDSPYIGREIHKEQALLCNPDVAEEDAVACRLEEVLPRGQHRQRARVQEDELGPVRGGGRAAVLQDEPRRRLRGVADGGPCGCDVWMGEIDRHGGQCGWGMAEMERKR